MNQPKWKYAIGQHPMWLIIAEDTVCAERTPPWGSPSVEEYAEVLSRSLDSLERLPRVILNWDFSAVELADMAERYPDLMRRMRKLTDQGRIAFVNGTYSQPHLQILSIESAIRQFEHGLKVIEDLTGYRVRCYAAQEPGFSPQLPQILRAFGYQTASTPDFPFGIRLINGRVQHWRGVYHFLGGDDMVNWLGLDGTTIPTWFKTSGWPNERVISDDAQRGLLNPTRLRVDMPDMVEIDQKWVDERTEFSELVSLDTTLEEMALKQPPEALVQFDANYAYTEGVDAEALSRANTRAESALLRLETLYALLPVDDKPDFDFDAAWKTILKAQHHDAYWTGAPELRAKCIDWLGEVEQRTNDATQELLRSLGSKLPKVPEGTQAVVVGLTSPGWRIVIPEFEVEDENIEVLGEDGRRGVYQTRKCSDGTIRTSALVRNEGAGYSTVFVKPGNGKLTESRPCRGGAKIGDHYCSARVQSDGIIAALRLDGARMLAGEGNRWVCVRDGKDESPVLVPGSARVERGTLYEAVESRSDLGPIGLTTHVSLNNYSTAFTIETELDFREPTEIGDYFDDRTKLHLAWNVGKDVEIMYLSGGCPDWARPGKSFIAYPAVSVAGKRGSLTFHFDSAVKCWLDEDGILRFVIAWGHNGNHFHNRQGPLNRIMGPLDWLKPMDLRLHGKHRIRYSVFPLGKSDSIHGMLVSADQLVSTPITAAVETGGGQLPWSQAIVTVRSDELVTLSIRPTKSGASVRVMNMSDRRIKPRLDLAPGWQAEQPRLLDGTPARTIPSYGIAEIPLTRIQGDHK